MPTCVLPDLIYPGVPLEQGCYTLALERIAGDTGGCDLAFCCDLPRLAGHASVVNQSRSCEDDSLQVARRTSAKQLPHERFLSLLACSAPV